MIICAPQLGISPESNLGGEVYDREILKSLDDLGVESLIILPFGKKHPEFKHAKIYFLPIPFVYPPWIFNLYILPYLFILYFKYHFEVLRIHSPDNLGLASIIFKLFHTKVVTVGTYHHLEGKNKFSEAIDKYVSQKFDLVSVVSQQTKQEISSKYSIEASKISVIPNGVDGKYRKTSPNQNLISKYHLQGKKVLLYLGQLIDRKNIPFLFKVIQLLPDDYVLMICGSGPLLNILTQKSQTLGLSKKVIFTGYVSENEKIYYYNLASVFVYPSKKEGFGLSIAEAIACKLQVIVPVGLTDVPGITELDSNPKSWVQTIKQKSGQRNSAKVNFSWKNSAIAYRNRLIGLLN